MEFLLLCVLCIFLYVGEGRSEVMVETVCVDMYKQPSLDHPALSNHKIQMKPTFPSKTMSKDPSIGHHHRYSFMNNNTTCSDGMVPILRRRDNKVSDIIDQNIRLLAQNQYSNNANIQSNEGPVRYRGASAQISVYNPRTEGDQFSSALVRVVDDYNHNEIISAGWAVGPGIFGDTSTRLYGSFEIGDKICVGTINCNGFVQIDRIVHFGLSLTDISGPKKKQFVVDLKIFKDRDTGNWWLTLVGEKGQVIKVGYWPKELFRSLSESAQVVQYGGYTWSSSSSGLSPPMGSGNRAGTDLHASAYFAHVKYINDMDESREFNVGQTIIQLTNQACYNLYNFRIVTPILGYIFSYGGPGGKCPAP